MLRIGKIEVAAPFCQAGLEGYSDAPMRIVARRRGCGYALTEALSDEMVALSGSQARRKLALRDEDHPIAGQIMGVEPGMMARAARVLVGLGYDAVDVNIACPVRKQARVRGGHLLAHPDEAIAILRAVRDAVPEVPVTVKMRRATDDSDGAAERFARIFAAVWDAGYDAACVHGRTVEQGYRGTANWTFLKTLKRAYPERTVLGSGDLFTGADAVRMMDETGVDGVWLARGAIGNPWIFEDARRVWRDRGAAGEVPGVDVQRRAIDEHLELTQAVYPEAQVAMRMRGVLIGYARQHPAGDKARWAAVRCRTLADVERVIRSWAEPSSWAEWPASARAAEAAPAASPA